ncbi:MAG: hypothetical protein R2708_25200 [Vicinamibacterales bacterium]
MGNDWVGNPDLAPSRCGVDLSMTLQRQRATFTANAYVKPDRRPRGHPVWLAARRRSPV